MKFQVKRMLAFLTEVARKTGKSLDFTSLRDLTDDINTEVREGRLQGVMFGERYIYEYIYRKIQKKKEDEYLNLNKTYVDTIARYSGYRDYSDFENTGKTKEKPKDKLKRCEGVWKSYVRTNSGRSELLIAPLHIFKKEGLTIIRMKGEGNIIYHSGLTLREGCLRCLLDAEGKDDRQIYMVLNLGLVPKPKVLMGVFAAMSNRGIPIAGREVWVREEENIQFEDLNHQVLDMDIKEEAAQVHPNILNYFKDKEKNCWKGTLPSSFDIRDLKNE